MLIGGLPGEIVAKESRLPRSGLVQAGLSQVKIGRATGGPRRRQPHEKGGQSLAAKGKGGSLPRAEADAASPTAPSRCATRSRKPACHGDAGRLGLGAKESSPDVQPAQP